MDSLSDPQTLMPDAARQAKIVAAIDAYNVERPGILKSCYTTAILAMVVYVGFSVMLTIGAYGIDEKHKAVGIVGGLLAFGGFKLWEFLWKPIHDHQLTLRYRLFPEIFGFIDGVSYSHGRAPWFLAEINTMKMVRFSSSENDDVLSGSHGGLSFELVEAKLILGSGKHKDTVFSGLILHFKLDTPFPGLLYAAKRGNWLQQWVREMFGTDVDLVHANDPALDGIYDFHTNHFSAARPVVQGPLAQALHYLRNEWYEGDVRIALRNDECFLLLPSKRDYFALPDIHNDVSYADVTPMIREMAVLMAVAHLMRKMGAEGQADPAVENAQNP